MLTHPQRQNAGSACDICNPVVEDRLNAKRAALTFVSLFALVPLLTVTLSIASALPARAIFEGKLNDFWCSFYCQRAPLRWCNTCRPLSPGALADVFGVIILLISAILMLRNVEKALNDIWRNRANRRPLQSFLLYWAVLSLGPIAIGLGLGSEPISLPPPMTGGIIAYLVWGPRLIGLLPFHQR